MRETLDAVDLLHQNCEKFSVSNVKIVPGLAQEVFAGLPVATHAFLGGTGGHVEEILRQLLSQNPHMRIVINVIALESLQAVCQTLKKMEIEPEIVCMQVSRAEKAGPYHLMKGEKSGVYPVIWRRGGMIPGILFAAASSGCGKTTITCGALRAWQRKGLKIKAWKCGPDYIDPMFHKQVLGIPGGNLDSFFLSKEALKAQYQQKNVGFDLAVMEGVMGYYDGLGGISTQASTYEVAQAVDVPVILILDGKGASLSLAAMLRGFLQYQKDSHIVGVILNRTSPDDRGTAEACAGG